jgi:hypothetical protein
MCIQSRQSLIPYYVGMNSIVGKPLQIHDTYIWEKKLQKKDPLQISCERKNQKKKGKQTNYNSHCIRCGTSYVWTIPIHIKWLPRKSVLLCQDFLLQFMF